MCVTCFGIIYCTNWCSISADKTSCDNGICLTVSALSRRIPALCYVLIWMLFQHEKIQFAEEVTAYDKQVSFNDMNLSRPLLKVNIPIPNLFSTVL